ncbi:hypothetical protein GP486_002443 [Trichoglossum hirsutum]|uniref:Conserved oligomeric Golgi complex subunit 1 n=1 Tax=Trichoglossum hirsutum TaxID=265104 RepID=A0A9P8LF79_9PEZI|nr:hypothetical protein GP486_002443 [Trichoglossum hirsutum]
MAAKPLDSEILKTWDDAFQYPIPTVRQFEKQLRSGLINNQEKLRTLVGASYRDLLGTAERIIEMDGTMQQVEAHIGAISRKCNPRTLDRIAQNYVAFDGTFKAQNSERYTFASQLSVLQACPVVISRLLHKGGSSLLAAKILVVSRLLHKALSQTSNAPPLVEKLRNQLASLRRHLLRHVDRQFSALNASGSALIEAMCAFSLATSSSPTDVLRHFTHVRLQAITAQLDLNEAREPNILKALKLYIQTLLDTRAVLPERLAESLARLKMCPLLEDPEVRAAAELNLDVHEKWISDDIRIFTPWVGHNDLQKSQAATLLKEWSKRSFSALIEGIRGCLSSMSDFRTLVKLRSEILGAWLDSRNRVAGFIPVESLERLRSAVNARLLELVRGRAYRLETVGAQVAATLQAWKAGITDAREDLWSPSTISMDIGNGATEFKNTVLDRSHGRNEAVLEVLRRYEAWLGTIVEITTVIKELRAQKWDDSGVDDVEDEIDLESRVAQLSGDDPKLLEDELDRSLTTAFQELNSVIMEAAAKSEDGSKAIFLLRVLREIRQQSPSLGNTDSFGLSIIPILHTRVVETTSSTALKLFERLISRTRWDCNVPARALWEGNPPLPVQPSPGVFRLLYGLTTSMAEQGSDIWSPTAARALKSHVSWHIFAALSAALAPMNRGDLTNGHDSEEVNGANEQEELDRTTANMNRDWAIQLLFDVLFLETVLSATTKSDETSTGSLGELARTLDVRSGVPEQLRERLRKTTQEYWKRTYLLFSFFA